LYANARSDTQPQTRSIANDIAAPDEPRIEVSEVRSVASDQPLPFLLDEQATILRVSLREPVAPGAATDIFIKFKGSVPEIDPEETGLVTHVIKQVGAAIRGERETRRARDLNFCSRGVMLLGTAFPLLAVHGGDDGRRKIEPSIGDLVFAETANFEVTVDTAHEIAVFGPGVETRSGEGSRTLSATMLRDFAIIAGRGLRAEQRTVGDITVRAIFLAEHESVGKRVLGNAADATRVYQTHFGPLPFKTITVAEAPLAAVIKMPPVERVPPVTVWLPELNRNVETVVLPDRFTFPTTSAWPESAVAVLLV
jgi:hypothetical protein